MERLLGSWHKYLQFRCASDRRRELIYTDTSRYCGAQRSDSKPIRILDNMCRLGYIYFTFFYLFPFSTPSFMYSFFMRSLCSIQMALCAYARVYIFSDKGITSLESCSTLFWTKYYSIPAPKYSAFYTSRQLFFPPFPLYVLYLLYFFLKMYMSLHS